MAKKHENATHENQTQTNTGANTTQNASAQNQAQQNTETGMSTTQGASPQGMQRGGSRQSRSMTRGGGFPSLFSTINPYEMMLNPFGFMRRMQEEMDRMFENFGALTPFETGRGGGIAQRGFGTFAPQIEVFERDNNLIVRADLPGVNKDDVHVELTDEGLVIEGERRYEHESNERGLHRTERSYGSFYRLIPLPEGVNAENATANFRNGVLEVTMQLPQRQSNRRRLEIQGEDELGQTQGQTQGQTTGQAKGQSAGK
jgi:HSP20 family protein